MDTAELVQIAEPGLLARNPWVTRRLINVDEYYRMVEAGILGEKERVELIEGELIAMAPIGDGHMGTVNAVNYLLVLAVGERGVVSVQNPLRLSNFTEPQPDFTVLAARADFYRKKKPTPDDVLLLVEVAHSSVRYDGTVKLPLYAQHGVPEYWIVRLDIGVVEIYRDPAPHGYRSVHEVRPGETLDIARLPGVTLPADRVLG